MIDRPDVLVLGAGGALGERWMHGVLAGLADRTGIDFRRVEAFVGTSAGALVAVHLLAGRPPLAPDVDGAADWPAAGDRPAAGDAPTRPDAPDGDGAANGPTGRDTPNGDAPAADDGPAAGAAGDAPDDGDAPDSDGEASGTWARARAGAADVVAAVPRALGAAAGGLGRLAGAAGAPLVPPVLRAAAPAGALVRAGALGRIPPAHASLDALGRRIARDRLRFDGRLRIVCVDRASGRRVVFGAPGAPRATVAEAVQASCSVPWLHRPVEIDGRAYVDGGLWSPTSIDAAPAGRDTHVLVLNPSAAPVGDAAGRLALHLAARSAAALEALALRRRGAHVRIVAPDAAAAAALTAPVGDPAPAAQALAAGWRQGAALA